MYRYYSEPIDGPRVAVVGDYNLSGDVLNVAVARCSSRDRFVRSVGRELAESRLSKGKYFIEFPIERSKMTINLFVFLAKRVAENVIETKKIY